MNLSNMSWSAQLAELNQCLILLLFPVLISILAYQNQTTFGSYLIQKSA